VSQPALRLVDENGKPASVDHDSGELVEATIESLAGENQQLRDEYSQLLRNYKTKCRQLSELERDRQADAERDPLWPLAVRLFAYHGKVLGHPKAEWTPERFVMVRKLKGRGKSVEEWLEECLRAIAGIRADPWRVAQGLTMWEDVFESRKKFERALAKCPAGWTPPPGAPVAK
jgi:hypothetical protein